MNCELYESKGLACPKPVKYAGWALAAALLIGFVATVPIWRHARAPVQPAVQSIMYQDLNRTREASGLVPLKQSYALQKVALAHAKDMAVNNYLDHYSRSGQSPFDRMHASGLHFVWAGENIAQSDQVQEAEQGLMQSPEHRANILNPHFRKVGIAAVAKPDGELIFVQEFTN